MKETVLLIGGVLNMSHATVERGNLCVLRGANNPRASIIGNLNHEESDFYHRTTKVTTHGLPVFATSLVIDHGRLEYMP